MAGFKKTSSKGSFIGKTQPAPFPGNGAKGSVPSGRFGGTGAKSPVVNKTMGKKGK